MKIKEIMNTEVICVHPETKIIEVSKILEKHRFHAIPVTDKKRLIKGIITESDFFIKDMPEIFLPSYITFLKRAEFAKHLSRKQKKDSQKILEAEASDIMTSECITINPENELEDLLKIFKEQKIHTVPIVDNQNKIVGITTQADIIKLVSGK